MGPQGDGELGAPVFIGFEPKQSIFIIKRSFSISAMGVYRPWLIGFLSYSTVNKVGQEHDDIRQEYEKHHFKEYCGEEWQRFFCIFIDRAFDD